MKNKNIITEITKHKNYAFIKMIHEPSGMYVIDHVIDSEDNKAKLIQKLRNNLIQLMRINNRSVVSKILKLENKNNAEITNLIFHWVKSGSIDLNDYRLLMDYINGKSDTITLKNLYRVLEIRRKLSSNNTLTST